MFIQPQPQYTLRTSVKESLQVNFKAAVRNFIPLCGVVPQIRSVTANEVPGSSSEPHHI